MDIKDVGKMLPSSHIPYNEAALSNEMLTGLAKELAYKQLQNNDKPLDDGSLQMLAMAQGPKAFVYTFPELNGAVRGINAVNEKDITRLLGTPRQKDISAFLSSPESRDKVMWTLTGNAIKADGLANRFGGK